jgi:hypothetical protein
MQQLNSTECTEKHRCGGEQSAMRSYAAVDLQ